eukprot:CAMPEP_0114981008 /NCGR_PEP_ID=MMETSP0216-20121206/5297_1 /TAXON_ID=223996 /ORGANISM="Protocruzia adherens, Strain Boccale" /LENGTH=532 /DNA_ID=CAMNT_0002342615 /DNA_START=87 /DNA_END=1685 /DNA_ORIENTATION=+
MSTNRKEKDDNSPLLKSEIQFGASTQMGSAFVDRPPDGLTRLSISGYAVGHVLNDLCAACWFNYLLYFLTEIIQIGNTAAGFVMLSGQIADGIATPLVGIASDKVNTPIGQRKPFYLFGYVLVVISFFFVFHQKFISSTNDLYITIYYAVGASLFNVGWASCQISHMSLVPSLSASSKRRDVLINLRTAFTYFSNVLVLLLALMFFKFVSDPVMQFAYLEYSVLGIGSLCAFWFFFNINEVRLSKFVRRYQSILSDASRSASAQYEAESSDIPMTYNDGEEEEFFEEKKNWRAWLKEGNFYRFASIYMFTRLAINVSMSLMAFYLGSTLSLQKMNLDGKSIQPPIQIALIPLIQYVISVITSFATKNYVNRIGRRAAISIGFVFSAAGLTTMIFLDHETADIMYAVAFALGVGFCFMLNSSMSIISDYVGDKGSSGAFVYGFFSLCDKFANGITLFFIMQSSFMSFDSLKDACDHTKMFLRITTSIIPLAAATGAYIMAFVSVLPKKQKHTITGISQTGNAAAESFADCVVE